MMSATIFKPRFRAKCFMGPAIIAIHLLAIGCSAQRPLLRFEFTEPHMGVQARIVMYAPSVERGASAAAEAFRTIAQLEQVMSDYRPDSELMQLCARAGQGPVAISDDLHQVLAKALEICAASDGAFDITIGPVTQLWRTIAANAHDGANDPHALEQAYALVNWRNVILNRQAKTAELLLKGMRLDLGGIGQGYAADRAMDALRRLGIRRCLVDISGDIMIGDPPPHRRGWIVALSLTEAQTPAPQAVWGGASCPTVILHNVGVSISGSGSQFIIVDGQRRSHLVDPTDSTSLGLDCSQSACIIANDACTADGLATAVAVMGPQRGIALVDSWPGAAAAIFNQDGTGARTVCSGGP